MLGHKSSSSTSSISWTFCKYKCSVSFSCIFDDKCSTSNKFSFSFTLTFRNKCFFSFTWIFHNKFSFGLSYTLANKRWSFLWTSGWIYNLCEENDQLYEVSFFKTVDYDLDKYERSTKYKNAKLILCEKCYQKINSISCFECYDKVYSHKKEYPTMIGACGGCFEIIRNYDGCSFCKLKHIFINLFNYLWNRKFKNCDFILCLECDQNIDRLVICFNCYNKLTNDKEKNLMKFGRCKECYQVITGSYGCLSCNQKRFQRKFDKWSSGNTEIDELIRYKQVSARDFSDVLEWIPLSRFTNIKYIAEGGFAKVYSATWIDGYIINWNQEYNNWKRSGTYRVALKVLKNSRDLSLDFLNEIKNLAKISNNYEGIIKFHGITQVPDTSNYALVFKLEDYDLRYCLNQYFSPCSNKKEYTEKICLGLFNIHKHGLIHKDLHIGNVLCSNGSSARISDFGFCKPANEASSHTNNTNTYGVMPYMAPEILRGKEYTQASDVYMLWTTPKNKRRNTRQIKRIDSKMLGRKSKNRPTSEMIFNTFEKIKSTALYFDFDFNDPITTKNFDTHPQAIYTSRLLNFKNLPEPVNCLNQEEFISSRYIMQIQTEVKNYHSECFDCAIID
ncbi:kinase-like domain-containing protein [Rhizophagus irregularis DAOM 181602=DAOM 197198]|nr:kinase-like domain-containing protein [Rhizophagus irregularis DAOM 181602=DAOM 197198]